MGRKRKPPGEAARDVRVTVLNLKGPVELKEWLDGVSARAMVPASAVARMALAEWAKRHGHPAPPKRI